jgi:hypothetical protein
LVIFSPLDLPRQVPGRDCSRSADRGRSSFYVLPPSSSLPVSDFELYRNG